MVSAAAEATKGAEVEAVAIPPEVALLAAGIKVTRL